VEIHDTAVVRFECECYPEDLRSARILRKMPFKSQANNQKISNSGLGKMQERNCRNGPLLLGVTPLTGCSREAVFRDQKKKTIPQSGKARANRGTKEITVMAMLQHPVKCFARYPAIV